MNEVGIKNRLTIEYDVLTGNMTFEHNKLSYAELLAMLEYTKWMVHKDWMESDKG